MFDLEIELQARGGLLATYYAADDLSTYPISGLLPHCPSPVPVEGRALQFTVDTCDSTRLDNAIDFDWGTKPALSGAFRGPSGDLFPTEEWSARWTGFLQGLAHEDSPSAESATYVLRTVSDGGVRVYVDGTITIDEWKAVSATTTSDPIVLPVSSVGVSLEVQYRHGSGAARLSLLWARSDGTGVPTEAFTAVPSSALANRRAIRGSPQSYVVYPGSRSASASAIVGAPESVTAGRVVSFTVDMNDAAGNRRF